MNGVRNSTLPDSPPRMNPYYSNLTQTTATTTRSVTGLDRNPYGTAAITVDAAKSAAERDRKKGRPVWGAKQGKSEGESEGDDTGVSGSVTSQITPCCFQSCSCTTFVPKGTTRKLKNTCRNCNHNVMYHEGYEMKIT